MAKAMSIGGMAVAAIAGLAFLGDLAMGIPFQRQSVMMDVCFLLAAGILGYLSFNAFRDSG